jgi:hypothetical protein
MWIGLALNVLHICTGINILRNLVQIEWGWIAKSKLTIELPYAIR